MPTIRLQQTNFISGEIDPLLIGRTDLPQYKSGLLRAKDVIIRPQGDIQRRSGSIYVDELDLTYNTSDDSDGYKCRFVPFEFDTDNQYMLLFEEAVIRVYKNKTLQTTVAHPYAVDDLPDLYTAQALDTLILTHEDFLPRRLIRNSDVSWTLETLTLENIPRYAFEIDHHEPTFTITPSAVDGNITISASSVTTDTGTAQAGSSSTITLKAASSFTADDQPNGMFIEITAGTGAGQTRHIEDYVASTKVATVYPDWDTAPDATSSYSITAFKEAAIGEYAEVKNGFGRARYVEFVSSTQMKAVVEVPFFDTSAIVAGDWTSEHGWEETWSSTRGWPRTCAFHEGRLYFGGSKTRPNTVWGSRVGDFFDFYQGSGLDDEAVEATINTERFNKIINLVSASDLQIFTTGGEFVVRPSTGDVLTPTNFQVRPQSRYGSEPGVRTVDVNGTTVFVQRGGTSVMAFQYSDGVGQYQTQPLSVLFSHLLATPKHLAIKRSQRSDETDTLYIINQENPLREFYSGETNCTVLSLQPTQNVYAASTFSIGNYSVGVIGDDVYFMEYGTYTVGLTTTNKYIVGVFDRGFLVDLGEEHSVSPSDTYFPTMNDYIADRNGLAYRKYKSSLQNLDERYGPLPQAATRYEASDDPATVTIPKEGLGLDSGVASQTIHVGLSFFAEIRFLPLEPAGEQGSFQFSKKRLSEVSILGGACGPFEFRLHQGGVSSSSLRYLFAGNVGPDGLPYYAPSAGAFQNLNYSLLTNYSADTGTLIKAQGMLGYQNSSNDAVLILEEAEPPLGINIKLVEFKLTVGS